MPRGRRGISESRDSLNMTKEQMDAALGDCLPGSDDSSSDSDDEGFGPGVENPLQRTPLSSKSGALELESDESEPNRFLACVRRCGCLSRLVARRRLGEEGHESLAPLELEEEEDDDGDQFEL